MCAFWKNGYQKELIAKKFESIKRLKDGAVSFSGEGYEEFHAVLESMIGYNNPIPMYIIRQLHHKGVKQAALNGEITAGSILKHISIEESKYSSQPLQPFVMLSAISIKNNQILPTFRLNDATITFSRYIPKQFIKAHSEHLETSKRFIHVEPPRDGQVVRIHVKAREQHEAAKIATETLDLLRGFMNYFLSPQYRMVYGGAAQPMSVVLFGPLHTLHETSGKSASKYFWYNNDYSEVKATDIKSNLDKLLSNIRYFRHKLSKHLYREEMEDYFRRYAQAMDCSDHNNAFLHLWSLLEKLTHTESSYETTVKRAAAQFTESEYHKQVLLHLKDYRNNMVHAGSTISDIQIYIYQLKRYVNRMLVFHTNNYFRFASLQEAGEFMDISSKTASNLLGKKRTLAYAMKFKNVH